MQQFNCVPLWRWHVACGVCNFAEFFRLLVLTIIPLDTAFGIRTQRLPIGTNLVRNSLTSRALSVSYCLLTRDEAPSFEVNDAKLSPSYFESFTDNILFALYSSESAALHMRVDFVAPVMNITSYVRISNPSVTDKWLCIWYAYVTSTTFAIISGVFRHEYGKLSVRACVCVCDKGKAIPLQAWTGPESSRRLSFPDFKTIWHMKMLRLSAIRTGRLYPPGNIPGTHFC